MASYDDPDSRNLDAGVEASARERSVAATQVESTRTTQSQPYTNSLGEPTIYPSELEGFQQAYGVTAAEAEEGIRRIQSGEDQDSVLEDIKANRTVYRQTYERVPAFSNALTAAEMRQRQLDAQAQEAQAKRVEVPTDTSQHGQHGPFADYREVPVSVKEVAQQTGVKEEVVREAVPGVDSDS
jgi:hypothetical protein